MDEQDIEFEITDVKHGTSGDAPSRQRGRISGLVASSIRKLDRRRIANIALVVLPVVLVATVLSQLAPYLGAAAERTSTTTTTGSSVPQHVIFVNGVPWGTLRIDGKVQGWAAGFSKADLPVARGRHTLTYVALPFPSLTCHFSVPADPSDDCLSPTDRYQDSLAQAISLEAYPNRLSSEQRTALFAAITDALNSTAKPTRIMPGERYRTRDGSVAVASQILTAQAVYTISKYTDITSVPDIGGSSPASRNDWQLQVPVEMSFFYTAPGNVISASASFPTAPHYSIVFVSVGYDGTWQATANNSNVTCQAAQNDLGNLSQVLQPAGPNGQNTFTSAPAPNPSDGCLIRLTGNFGTAQHQVSGTALFLYRFGVTLAANDLAHRAAPSLPMITGQEETNLVRQVASKLGPQG